MKPFNIDNTPDFTQKEIDELNICYEAQASPDMTQDEHRNLCNKIINEFKSKMKTGKQPKQYQ